MKLTIKVKDGLTVEYTALGQLMRGRVTRGGIASQLGRYDEESVAVHADLVRQALDNAAPVKDEDK